MEPIQKIWEGPPPALFWDQSLVWGLICVQTLQRLALPFELLTGKEIAEGRLAHHRVLMVPGGWATHKMKALGKRGQEEIRRFILQGGSYLGFCGGAGLALTSPQALSLVPLERMPLSERLPSASGRVKVEGNPAHPAWKNLPLQIPVSIWWPSQFSGNDEPFVRPLATYTATEADFMVADLSVSDLNLAVAVEEGGAIPWEELENVYGINLNPQKILGHPAIIEATKGKGRLVLSYPHLETPEDTWGHVLLHNILTYLDKRASDFLPHHIAPPASRGNESPPSLGVVSLNCLIRAREAADELIRFGESHLLWTWRKPWLLHWRRGIRGLEYGSLAVILKALVELGQNVVSAKDARSCDPWQEQTMEIEAEVVDFCRLAKRLLLEEKLAGLAGTVSKLGSVNETVDRLRQELFGSRMSHGGLSRNLFNAIDTLLLQLIRLQPRD